MLHLCAFCRFSASPRFCCPGHLSQSGTSILGMSGRLNSIVFGACNYDMVIHKSEILYIILIDYTGLCSTHIAGSCLMQATCGWLAVDIMAHTKTRGKPFGDRVLPWLYRFNKGIAWATLWIWMSLLACRRPKEEKQQIGIKQHPII